MEEPATVVMRTWMRSASVSARAASMVCCVNIPTGKERNSEAEKDQGKAPERARSNTKSLTLSSTLAEWCFYYGFLFKFL